MFHFLPTWHQWYKRPSWPHWLKNRGCDVPWFQQEAWEVLVSVIQGYPPSVTQAVASVIPFAIAYLCESHFSALSATKVKKAKSLSYHTWPVVMSDLSKNFIFLFKPKRKNSGLFFGMFFWAELMSLFWFIFTIWMYYWHFLEVINFCIKIQECGDIILCKDCFYIACEGNDFQVC